MGLCKCIASPAQGRFEAGGYYGWLYAEPPQEFIGRNSIGRNSIRKLPAGKHSIQNIFKEKKLRKRGRSVSDDRQERIVFSAKEYARFFRDVQCADVSISIYIDRKKELLFVPNFKHKDGFGVSLDSFERLSFPYTEADVGKTFQDVWEKYREHPVVTAEEAQQTTPYYKIVTKGKGYRAFSSGRWMLHTDLVTSENEIIFTYWHKKKSGAFGMDAGDRVIRRILQVEAAGEEIGRAVLAIFEEALDMELI